MKEKKSLLLQTVKQMNQGVCVAGIGFVLYMAASALNWGVVAGLASIVSFPIALYVFVSVVAGREKDKEAVTYNLLWGSGALAILLLGCAAVPIKTWFGL